MALFSGDKFSTKFPNKKIFLLLHFPFFLHVVSRFKYMDIFLFSCAWNPKNTGIPTIFLFFNCRNLGVQNVGEFYT